MNKALRVLGALLCCLVLSACAAPVSGQVVHSLQDEERLLSEVRVQYRDAALIVEGICTGEHINADGFTCYDMEIEKILAGNASAGDMVHCTSSAMQDGERYVLFLSAGEDVHYAEDISGYNLLSEGPLPIVEEDVLWNGKKLSLSALEAELDTLMREISVPAPVLYYQSLQALVEASDEIFIGRLVDLPPMSGHSFAIRNGGTMEKAQYNASIVTVEVFGSIKGAFGTYGQTLEFVYSPERVGGMLDSTTLLPTDYSVRHVPDLQEEEIYLFFLIAGADSKQPYYFPVNPVQSAVKISGDVLLSTYANKPMYEYGTLTAAVEAIHQVLSANSESHAGETPPLVVEEP